MQVHRPEGKYQRENPKRSDIDQHREIVCVGKRVSYKISEVGKRREHR
jgi:uncharacterized protein (UPF0218 family)